MSVEVFRRSIEAWNASDWETLESLWNPDGEIESPEGWPETGTFHGWPAIREQLERVKGSWAEEHVEAVAVKEVPAGLLADLHWTMRGDASGAALEVEMWMLSEFRNGLFARATYFLDREAAETAAGDGA
jgi:ketosteroid isomerase-like protein